MHQVRRLLAVLILAAALVALGAAPAGGQGTTSPRCASYTVLKPSNEVRPADTTDPVESRAIGAAAVHISGARLTFSVVIFNPARETFTAGHIHEAPAGVNGGVVVPLFGGSSSSLFFAQLDSIAIDETLAARICANLPGFYVNYHTTQDPMGAVRGQLG